MKNRCPLRHDALYARHYFEAESVKQNRLQQCLGYCLIRSNLRRCVCVGVIIYVCMCVCALYTVYPEFLQNPMQMFEQQHSYRQKNRLRINMLRWCSFFQKFGQAKIGGVLLFLHPVGETYTAMLPQS